MGQEILPLFHTPTMSTTDKAKEAMMHIGVMLFPTQHPVDIAMVARKSEEFGFDSLWLGEHPIMPVQSASRFPGSPTVSSPQPIAGSSILLWRWRGPLP